MQIQSIAAQLAPPGRHFEVRGRTFRMKVGRAMVEIDLDLSQAEIHNAKEFIGVVIDKNRRPSRSVVSPLPQARRSDVPSPKLSEATKFYLKKMRDRKRGKSILTNTQGTLHILMAVAGDVPISQIGYKVIEEFFNHLRWWPRRANSRVDLRGLTPRQKLDVGIAEGQEVPVAEGTRRSHLAVLNAFFEMFLKVGEVPSNPMEIFKAENPSTKAKKTRFPLDPATLAKIFNPDTFEPWARKFPHRWWIPSIALHTGARVEEIAQLRAADIGMDQGVMCFFFKPLGEDAEHTVVGMREKSFKNDSSSRVVPVAQALLDAGLMQYVEEVRQAGLLRLFPQLKAGTCRKTGELNGAGYSVGHVMQFAAYLRKTTGLKSGIGSHAFRHTLVTALRTAGQSKDVVASITGHSEGEYEGDDAREGKYRNLDRYTACESSESLRPKQVQALASFKPGVVLPIYSPGQFDHRLGPNAKKYP
ncbi:site-specific integrase [Pseudoxanthomonas sp.]|jgi:Site-specific recombinase XerD|uniref:site-specific integrase n=1 Tax=Pseudoxanthomonas sp. TaxID=1871049 RepID=UPI002FE3E11B